MGDGAMCHYCRKYQCECNLSAEEWRERCKNAEAEVERLRQAVKRTASIARDFGAMEQRAIAAESGRIKFNAHIAALEAQLVALQAEVSRLTDQLFEY